MGQSIFPKGTFEIAIAPGQIVRMFGVQIMPCTCGCGVEVVALVLGPGEAPTPLVLQMMPDQVPTFVGMLEATRARVTGQLT